ncbi:MAG: PilZ domain-containing protein [Deltaproteobacteria bacterium]
MENRTKFRFLIPGSIVLQCQNGDKACMVKGQLVDFGRKGVGILTESFIRNGTEVKFFLMNREYDFRLKGSGRIKNVRPVRKDCCDFFRVGMEFVDVNEKLVFNIVERIKEMGW